MRHRAIPIAIATALLVTTAIAADNEFISIWKAPGAKPLDFVGRKVAAVVIVDALDLQMSAEEALAREISARGPIAVPSYRIVPREDLKSAEKAKGWFEKNGIQGMAVIRVLGTDKEKVYSSVVYTSAYYANGWDYYGYGWTSVYHIGGGRTQTSVTVETLLYDLTTGGPIWAGVTRTTDPKNPQSYMNQLAKDIVKKLKEAKLTK
jgi:hypothetical protein